MKAKVISSFEDCLVTDEHLDYIHFHVPNPATSWHSLFSNMEMVKNQFSWIQDYSITETSLEQIFLGFAKDENVQSNASIETLL